MTELEQLAQEDDDGPFNPAFSSRPIPVKRIMTWLHSWEHTLHSSEARDSLVAMLTDYANR